MMRYTLMIAGILFALLNIHAYHYEPIPNVPFIPFGLMLLGIFTGISSVVLGFFSK